MLKSQIYGDTLDLIYTPQWLLYKPIKSLLVNIPQWVILPLKLPYHSYQLGFPG
jgi:hypothetical protein